MDKKQALIRQLKKVSIISVYISVVFLFVGLFCLYLVKIQVLTAITWSILGLAFIITCVTTITRGVMEVKQKQINKLY